MPTYVYRCESCGAECEQMQGINDAPAVHCESCGADALRRQIVSASFILKGRGWAKHGYGLSLREREAKAWGINDKWIKDRDAHGKRVR